MIMPLGFVEVEPSKSVTIEATQKENRELKIVGFNSCS